MGGRGESCRRRPSTFVGSCGGRRRRRGGFRDGLEAAMSGDGGVGPLGGAPASVADWRAVVGAPLPMGAILVADHRLGVGTALDRLAMLACLFASRGGLLGRPSANARLASRSTDAVSPDTAASTGWALTGGTPRAPGGRRPDQPPWAPYNALHAYVAQRAIFCKALTDRQQGAETARSSHGRWRWRRRAAHRREGSSGPRGAGVGAPGQAQVDHVC